MYLCIEEAKRKGKWNKKDYTKGFVLCDDKGTQDFKVFVYDYEPLIIDNVIERCEQVQFYYEDFIKNGNIPKRCKDCTSYVCERAEKCPMKDACWEKGMGRIEL
jgi:hypothetical protein